MNTLLKTLTALEYSAIIFGIIWYVVVLIIKRFTCNNKKSINKSELQKEAEKEGIRSNYKLLIMLKDEYIKRINNAKSRVKFLNNLIKKYKKL